MTATISRRSFIKAGLLTAGSVATAGLPIPDKAIAAEADELCTLLDIRKCIACGSCVEACREANENKFPEPEKPFPTSYPTSRVKIQDWSSDEKRAVDDRLTPYNWLFIQYAAGRYEGKDFELSIPRRCMHCRNAPCSDLCPFGAAFKQKNGIVRIHPEVCMGGSKCKAVCPWHIPQRQSGTGLYLKIMPQFAGNGVMYKCDRCYDRIENGELPACIEACPEDVQEIGPRPEMIKKAHALAKQMDGYIYGETENGGTNTLYVSPIPFEVLNQNIRKSGRKPHLANVAGSMADTNKLIAALAIAPVAGAFSAAARFMNLAKKTDQSENAHEE